MEEVRDATRRTRLATERTYLAWWRTGLTAFAVAFGAGRIVPELTGGAAWPYAAIGVAFIAYGYVRQKQVDEALARGDYAPLDDRAAIVFAVAGLILGLATIVLVIAGT